MKKSLLTLSLLLLTCTSYGQDKLGYHKTQADYERVFTQFTDYYNHDQPDKIKAILSSKWGAEQNTWTTGFIKMLKLQLGDVVSSEYIGTLGVHNDDYGKPMVYFKVLFTKPAVCDKPRINGKKDHTTCITLDEEGKIQAISFVTSSFHVDNIIAQY